MLYLFSALYQEAAPLIAALELKKVTTARGIDSFQNAEGSVLLTLTGAGNYNAIAAVSALFAIREPKAEDQVIFYGSAALVRGSAFLYRIREIHDTASGRRAFPDLLYDLPLPEAAAVTLPHIMASRTAVRNFAASEHIDRSVPLLADMESYGVYEAAARHVGPDQITILRFASDAGEKISARELEQISAGYVKNALPVIEAFRKSGAQKTTPALSKEDEALTDLFASWLHSSASMKGQLRQLVLYASLSGIDWQGIAREYMALPCRDRVQGKKILTEFRERILHAG